MSETIGNAPSVLDLMRKAWTVPSRAQADVIAERNRQQDVEGWTPEHDDGHCFGALARAAACYAEPCPVMVPVGAAGDDGKHRTIGEVPRGWPWSLQWWKPTDRRRDLVKAAALIIAEIERLDRAEAKGAKL